jgi:hypothetical protein
MIVCGEEDIDRCVLSTRQMERVISTKTYGLDGLSTLDSGVSQAYGGLSPSEHVLNTNTAFAIGRIADLFLHDGTADPLPFACLTVPQDEEDRFGFEPYTILTLIVVWPVQATDVQVDAWH